MPPLVEQKRKSMRNFKAFFQPVLLIGVVCLVYWNSLSSPFLFDDAGAVINNPTIHRIWSWNAFLPPSDGSTTTGRPIVNLTFALNYAISGTEVWSYHVTNILIHALNALLLLGILRRTFLAELFRDGDPPHGERLAFVVALLWAVHPLNSESVVCVAQRTESLCALFYLLTIYGFSRSTLDECPSGGWRALSIISCLLGMATKEVTVTAPVLVFLYDRTFVSGGFRAAWQRHRAYYLVLASTWCLLLALLAYSGGARGASAGFGLGVSSWRYLLQQAHAVVLYLKLSFWPYPLVFDYGDAVPESLRDVWFQGGLVLGLLGATIWALVRKPVMGFAGAWFFGILAPSSSIVPLVTQSMAEHRMYLPLVAVIAVFVIVIRRWLISAPGWPLTAFLAIMLGASTFVRNRDYRDGLTIWSDTVVKYPQSARGHNNLALELQRLGRNQDANLEFSRAVALQPTYVSAHSNWGTALLAQGRPNDAIEHLRIAVELAPTYADAHLNFGNALAAVGRTREAIVQYEEALRLQPTAADVHFNLGVALDIVGQHEGAAQHLRTAVESRPDLVDAHYRLARLADDSDHMEEAEKQYEDVLRLAPRNAAAEAGLGVLLARVGRMESAVEHLENAVRLRPNDPDTLSNLGNVYLLLGHTREAIAQYEESLRLRSDDARTRDNLKIARETLHNGER